MSGNTLSNNFEVSIVMSVLMIAIVAFLRPYLSYVGDIFTKDKRYPSGVTSFYDIIEKDASENDVSFSKFKGKVVYGVNVASACGLTGSGYDLINQISEIENVAVLLFPCNQFGGQEPGNLLSHFFALIVFFTLFFT